MISVVIAAYNGEKYIVEQVKSILPQLGVKDEIVVSNDNSTDNTVQILQDIKDERIRIVNGPSKGVIKNFENGLNQSKGDYIFLCDQDDVWLPERVEKVMKTFSTKNADLVVTNYEVVDKELNVELGNNGYKHFYTGILKNYYKNSYIGAMMAFKREVLELALPFPNKLPMHDSWIGILAEVAHKNVSYIDEPLVLYRRTGSNLTTDIRRNIFKVVSERFGYAFLLLIRLSKNIMDRKG